MLLFTVGQIVPCELSQRPGIFFENFFGEMKKKVEKCE